MSGETTRHSDLSWSVSLSLQGNSSVKWTLGGGGREHFLHSACPAKLNQRPSPHKAASLFPPSDSVAHFSETSAAGRPAELLSSGDPWSGCWGPAWGAQRPTRLPRAPAQQLRGAAPRHVCPSWLNPSPDSRLLSGSTPEGLLSSCEPAAS